ncbi:MAG: carboxypeptidase regulatory-like domain-containing protein [Acidobacteria bacterium]|nr:carboxypeptidase regulatory-like domain-containing protein [Acidobacteriota bacterium]
MKPKCMPLKTTFRMLKHGAVVTGVWMLFAGQLWSQSQGAISGTVMTKASGSRPVRLTIDQRVCGNALQDEGIVVDAAGHLANAVVTLVGVKAPNGNPAAAGVMNEKCRFSPHVQVVKPNAMLTTSSADPVLHTTNAQTESGKSLFNVAVPVPGIKINKPVHGAGMVRLSCNTHPWMKGWVVVTDDVTVVTGADGAFTLPEVPPGKYELRVWHESLKGATQTVVVSAGQPAKVTFELR